jgi:SAM-dependent methyltransferase
MSGPESLAPTGSKASGTDGSCLLCKATAWRLVVRSPDLEYRCRPGTWDLVECSSCGHVYLHPLPAASDVPALYPPWYYTVNPNSPIYMEGSVVEAKMAKDAENLRRQTGSLRVRSIVDIGGGNLTRLIKLKEAFARSNPSQEIEGVCLDFQFDPAVADQARTAGIRLVTGNVETDVAALSDGGHDLVIMRQLIEHLRDPRAALNRLRPKIRPGGWLVIDTPNRGGLDYCLFHRRFWGGYHVPRHFHLFTQESLASLVTDCGYQIVRQGYTPSIAFWIISLRNCLGLNSVERGKSPWEFLNLKNLPVVGAFYVLDLISSKLGIPTSNQFMIVTPNDR